MADSDRTGSRKLSIHIDFTDGSNPYVRYGMTREEFEEDV